MEAHLRDCKGKSQQKKKKPPVPVENLKEEIAPDQVISNETNVEDVEFSSLNVEDVGVQSHIPGLQPQAHCHQSHMQDTQTQISSHHP